MSDDGILDIQKEKIETNYKEKLRHIELDVQKNIESVWDHAHLHKEQTTLTFEDLDLFSEEAASVFGLTRKELIITGVTSGAVTGAGIDLLFAGHTLLLGGAIGGLVGAAGAYFGFDELSDIKVLGQTVGKRTLVMGPMKNRNFPYILLGRAIFYTSKTANRSHASRNVADFKMDSTFKEKWLNEDLRKSLEACHKKFRSGNALQTEVFEEYAQLIKKVLIKLIK